MRRGTVPVTPAGPAPWRAGPRLVSAATTPVAATGRVGPDAARRLRAHQFQAISGGDRLRPLDAPRLAPCQPAADRDHQPQGLSLLPAPRGAELSRGPREAGLAHRRPAV